MTDFYFDNVITAYLIYVTGNSLVDYGVKLTTVEKKAG
jgi:hypothetical protein